MEEGVAHAHDAECLVVHQLLVAQWHGDAFFAGALVLDEFAVIMPEEDAKNEREQSKRGSPREGVRHAPLRTALIQALTFIYRCHW